MRQVFFRLIACLGITFIFLLAGGQWVFSAEKMKPEEVLARHLQALGTPEARAAVKTRVMKGEASVHFIIGSSGRVNGAAEFASDTSRFKFDMAFGYSDYDSEQLIFNGKDALVGYVRPGVRSSLGIFVNDYATAALNEGIIGGVTNIGWALASNRRLRLNARGLKEIDGKRVHVLRYQSKRGDLRIDLGFDPETFRHLVTEYFLEIPTAGVPSELDAPTGQRPSYWRAFEQFDDFREIDGITLPHAYKLRVEFDGKGTFMTEWKVQFSETRQNLELPPDVFKLR